jgi:hypothetical protein
VKKRLSGGERKRLNIGLDMISSADVFLFDEPSSGLSSKDSEHVIEIIRSMAHKKIVFVTIHQPTSKLFQMFSKALLLDKGGRIVFFGTPREMLEYFAAAEHEQHFGTELGGCPACGTTRPEFIFDVLETPLRDLSGDVIYEENSQGQLVAARRFSPDYWRDKYEGYRLLQEVKQVNVRKTQPTAPQPAAAVATATGSRMRWRDEWTQFRALWRRAFLSKLRNRLNIILTLLIPPTIAVLVGMTLHYTDDPSGQYDFASAFHIPTYIFIALLLALFLGLVNSVTDIIRDRVMLHRERNLDVRLPYYIAAKMGTLALFCGVQCAIFTLVGNHILEIRGMFWPYFFWLFVTSVSGASLGLLISSLVTDSMNSILFVPLVLIPQLIFSGALIKYSDMNRDLDVRYTFMRWFKEHPEDLSDLRKDAQLQIPLISRLVATHYSYEALIVSQAKLNPLTRRQDEIQQQIDKIVAKREQFFDTKRLEELKDTLALLSGLESGTAKGVEKRLKAIDAVIEKKKPLDLGAIKSKTTGVTAERLYTNQKVTDLVAKAETEQNDYRRTVPANTFFSPEKRYFNLDKGLIARLFHLPENTFLVETSVYVWNSFVLFASSFAMLCLLYLILRRQLRPHGT